MAPENRPFQFEGADVRAKATFDDEQIDFKVSSHAMSFASPVWKKFIFPPFPRLADSPTACGSPTVEIPAEKKKKPDEAFPDTELDFTEDNGNALLILLQIAHLQFANIPKRHPYETLLGVAILCNQYDCRKLVKPWLADWLEDEWYESNLRCQEGWLFIAYYFGRHDIFSQLAMTCVLQANTGNGDECLIDGGYHYTPPNHTGRRCSGSPLKPYPLERDGIPFPSGIVESIFDCRRGAIKEILKMFYHHVQSFASGSGRSDRRREFCSFSCDAVHYGAIVKGLQENGLWPQPSPGDFRISIHDLIKRLKRVDDSVFKVQAKLDMQDNHSECHPRGYLVSAASEILSDLQNPAPESHLEYMDTVNSELGLSD